MQAHVRMHGGTPTLFLDGKPVHASFHLVGYQAHPDGLRPTQPIMREYAAAGVHLYSDWFGSSGASDLGHVAPDEAGGPRDEKAARRRPHQRQLRSRG